MIFWLGVKMNITVIVSKALNKENWKKGVNYLNKYGVKGFIRKLNIYHRIQIIINGFWNKEFLIN